MTAATSPADIATAFRTARRDPTRVVVEGLHALKHAIRFGARIIDIRVHDLEAVAALAADLAPDVADRLAQATVVDRSTFDTLAPRSHPTGVIAIAERPAHPDPLDVPGTIVVLERPVRPNNVGAAVRVVAASGAGGLLAIDGADPWGPEAVRTAAGLQFAVAIGTARELRRTDRIVVALDPDGDPDLIPPPGSIVCFGTERGGLSEELRERADVTVSLPMRPGVSSLNLATAVAATLYRR